MPLIIALVEAAVVPSIVSATSVSPVVTSDLTDDFFLPPVPLPLSKDSQSSSMPNSDKSL